MDDINTYPSYKSSEKSSVEFFSQAIILIIKIEILDTLCSWGPLYYINTKAKRRVLLMSVTNEKTKILTDKINDIFSQI